MYKNSIMTAETLGKIDEALDIHSKHVLHADDSELYRAMERMNALIALRQRVEQAEQPHVEAASNVLDKLQGIMTLLVQAHTDEFYHYMDRAVGLMNIYEHVV